MKHFCKLVSFLASAALYSVYAGQADNRFAGVWAGSETFQAPANFMQKGQTITKPALIAIADPKNEVGVAQGLLIGRYSISNLSSGSALFYGNGRRHAKLILSADGNSFTEDGEAIVGAPDMTPPAYCKITGTFHRQNRK